MAENIKVAVRVRPFLPDESPRSSCVSVHENQVMVGNGRCFAFDAVFDRQATSDDVYVSLGQPLANAFLEGFNVSTIAYGQTGAGKTHTMATLSTDVIQEMFCRLSEAESADSGVAQGFSLTLSVLEVYNETLGDLLRPHAPAAGSSATTSPTAGGSRQHHQADLRSSPVPCSPSHRDSSSSTLQLREDPKGGVYVSHLAVVEVRTEEELLTYISQATANRRTASTLMNATSSRSHCVVTLTLERRGTTSKCCFVDLAGSERLKKSLGLGGPSEHLSSSSSSNINNNSNSCNDGSDAVTTLDRMREGISINGGLLALGNVIVALSEKKPHVPYRSSKLTRLLQPMLGGNSKTAILACISPVATSLEETLNTLKYADRAKSIKTSPHFVVSSVYSDEDAKRIITALRRELEVTQQQLTQALRGRSVSSGATAQSQLRSESSISDISSATTSETRRSRSSAPRGHPSQRSSSASLPPTVPSHTAAMTAQLRELQRLLAQEKSMTMRLEEDLFEAEYRTMVEVEKRKALEERVAELEMMYDESDNLSAPSDSSSRTPAANDSLLRQLEEERDALKEMKERQEADQKQLIAAIGNVDTTDTSIDDTGLLGDIEDKTKQIQELELQNRRTTKQLEQYQQELAAASSAKRRLQEDLSKAEAQLEEMGMAQQQKNEEKARLQQAYAERLQNAEEKAADYQRRVKRAEQEIRMRALNIQRITLLQHQVSALREEAAKQRTSKRAEQLRATQQSAAHAAEMNRLQRQMRESENQVAKLQRNLSSKEQEIARARSAVTKTNSHRSVSNGTSSNQSVLSPTVSSTTAATPVTGGSRRTPHTKRGSDESVSAQAQINSELAILEQLEKELAELHSCRQVLLKAQTHDAPRYLKAVKGYNKRLQGIELGLAGANANSSEHKALVQEKKDIVRKIHHLESFSGMFQQASLQLDEFDTRIDSLNETRKFHLRQVRQLQHCVDGDNASGSKSINNPSTARSNVQSSVLEIQTSRGRPSWHRSQSELQTQYVKQLEETVELMKKEAEALRAQLALRK